MPGKAMRLSSIWDAKVKTLDGETLGRVHEVHADGGRIVALTCGAGSIVERLTAKKHGRRVPWECVVRIGKGEVFVTPGPPQRKTKSGASRNRQGTRRPSARRSTR
jgi:sporulation protein YlmC with PRC-barrel domain